MLKIAKSLFYKLEKAFFWQFFRYEVHFLGILLTESAKYYENQEDNIGIFVFFIKMVLLQR